MMTRKKLYVISAILYLALMGLITLPPITAAIDRVQPHILGIPFFQFFLIGVPVVLAAWLIVWFLWECRLEDRETGAATAKTPEGGEKHV